jgi:hypothetical protein
MTISSRFLSQDCIRHRISDENATVFPGRPSPTLLHLRSVLLWLVRATSVSPRIYRAKNIIAEEMKLWGRGLLGRRKARRSEGGWSLSSICHSILALQPWIGHTLGEASMGFRKIIIVSSKNTICKYSDVPIVITKSPSTDKAPLVHPV